MRLYLRFPFPRWDVHASQSLIIFFPPLLEASKAVFGCNSKIFAKRESCMHGVLNVVYLKKNLEMDATLRAESNESN